MSRNKDGDRKRRGQVSCEIITQYKSEANEVLISLLSNRSAQARTAAATILGKRKSEIAIQSLCAALMTEKALYTRLAICEALASIGEAAIDPLINLLGKIGSNQHCELPQKGFYKRSYPLPRDIAARTLIRMGLPVLNYVEPVLQTGERIQILEAVDVIGHISNRYGNDQCLESLLALYGASVSDDLLRWKLLRSFQAFPHPQVTDILLQVIGTSTVSSLRWEALRSLGLQEREFDRQILVELHKDGDRENQRVVDFYFPKPQTVIID